MNRRTFITAGAALALSTQSAFGKLVEQLSGSTAVSYLTDAEVDLGRTGFMFHSRFLDPQGDSEIMAFSNETCDASVRFIPSGTDPEAYIEERIAGISGQMENDEVVGFDVFDDGGWMAMSVLDSNGIDRGVYLEVQLNAFADYDLEVYLVADHDSLPDDLDLMQQVLLEGMEPFLFTEESEMPELIFSSTANSGSSRTGRSSSSRQSQTTTGNSRSTDSTNSGTSATADLDADEVVEVVRQHQSQFMGEVDRFYEIVEMLGDETSSDAEEVGWFDELLNMMFSWTEYPVTASDLTFPPELAGLKSTYVEWSDGVGAMGVTMGEWMLGEGDIDTFLDAVDVAMQLNSVLSAELRTLGVVISPAGQGFALPGSFPHRSLYTYVATHKIA